MSGHSRATLLAAVSGAVLVLAALPALAASGFVQPRIATSPSVSLSTDGRFVVGSQIGQATPPNPDGDCTFEGYHFGDIPLEMRWSGTGPITGYDLYRGRRGEFEQTPVLANTRATSYRYLIGDYDGSCGGTNDDIAFRVVAHSTNGEASVAINTSTLVVWQDTGRSPAFADSILVRRTGAWQQEDTPGSDAGSTTWTTQRHATSTYRLDSNRRSVALVMATGPGRGRATITFDGRRTTVDTWAAHYRPRVVVWKAAPRRAGVHTLTVTGQGTHGRSRVEIDAIIVS